MAFKVYYIPAGPTNLAGFFPDLDFSLIADYQIEVIDDTDATIATTPIYSMKGECCEDKIRIHFLNFLGAIDAINFKEVTDEFEAKSDLFTRPTSYPLIKSQHGRNRYNVKANNTITVEVADYPEEANKWINELVATPRAWIEWTPEDDEDPDYLPIIINDIKILDLADTDRFQNAIRLQITYSFDNFIIRN